MTFTSLLRTAWAQQNSLLTLGLDPDLNRLPEALKGSATGVYDFCTGMVDACAPYVSAFKPQFAYFASIKAEDQLERICAYIKQHHPHLPIIMDSKRGDIGSTARHYALEAFERYGADAITVSPYMGHDSVEPYFEWKDKGVIVLCRTSNPGGSDLQFLQVDGMPLYLHVAKLVAEQWNAHTGQCALVVGATFPDEIAKVRAVVGDLPLLVPGIGAQGGDIPATVNAGLDSQGAGMMINSSRAILYASAGSDWQDAAARVAKQTRDAINAAR
ncbi:orotidine-5'-phosphate decarboxylase [Paenalcaligenes hominis]|uniref:orotidine-5'-phosphate decarboxylase n=1 Tax=Paenalcaligenes hominis TaxID=643674 RepID=UPI0035251D39